MAFTIEILMVFVELLIETLFTGDTPLRTLGDGLLGSATVAVLFVALITASVVTDGSEVVLSAVLALRLVETVVDFAIALAEGE